MSQLSKEIKTIAVQLFKDLGFKKKHVFFFKDRTCDVSDSIFLTTAKYGPNYPLRISLTVGMQYIPFEEYKATLSEYSLAIARRSRTIGTNIGYANPELGSWFVWEVRDTDDIPIVMNHIKNAYYEIAIPFYENHSTKETILAEIGRWGGYSRWVDLPIAELLLGNIGRAESLFNEFKQEGKYVLANEITFAKNFEKELLSNC
ncbi:MAG: hypothetical protein IJS07_02695 [Bacteroidales bacterium]|nr:hypothetical protein [Bacteroidales bacterium]